MFFKQAEWDQRKNAPATKSDELSSMSKTHLAEEESAVAN